ncbi:EI24 domain-containing protein [Arcobacter roscoffensis]|uniref:EI24 domain-containing protein n=1 Tax=Arcobacter roscoffensis TaxID=2961520 RepID=A0ABY5E3N3_9BACT|nr:EI24 domain-containing protein [Arcobacter roscoffensis]UTJ05728.1 EI24 domain-containing protein [Arcobacter roscoffensis]
MTEIDILSRSLKDFLTSKMLKISLVPLIVTMILIYSLFFAAADFGITALQEAAEASQNGEEVIVDENAPFYFVWATYLVVFLFKYSFTSWIAGFLLYTIGSIIVLQASVILTLVVIGFLTPMILGIVHKRHYSHITLHGHGSLLSPLWVLLKSSFMMILLFILLIPVYFVPVLNIIAFALPLYYFFHKLLNYDVASTLLSEEEYKKIYKKEANAFRGRTLFLYLVSMIPFITLFTAVFYIIYLGHAYFVKLDKMYEFEVPDINNKSEEKKEEVKLLEDK